MALIVRTICIVLLHFSTLSTAVNWCVRLFCAGTGTDVGTNAVLS
jgi:hypothetical protein